MGEAMCYIIYICKNDKQKIPEGKNLINPYKVFIVSLFDTMATSCMLVGLT